MNETLIVSDSEEEEDAPVPKKEKIPTRSEGCWHQSGGKSKLKLSVSNA